jgi:cellulose synthase/poly-beta-1,6-N-acetylglucosamine synthase-like glycosyltransferase
MIAVTLMFLNRYQDIKYMLFEALIIAYLVASAVLLGFGLNLIYLSYLSLSWSSRARDPIHLPKVTVQLPLYNELYVAKRLIDAVCRFDYPLDKLEIQVLDDSDDETKSLIDEAVSKQKSGGVDIKVIRRNERVGYKAGALQMGLESAKGEFIAIFDSDFIPPSDFILKALPYFSSSDVGLVQTRWGHMNEGYSLLTKAQAMSLNTQFLIEHPARDLKGWFMNFNGTAGIFRRETLFDAGGWSAGTLTEDLDLSLRAQLRGWTFKYAKDVVCPAELPISVTAYRRQQERWAIGTVQCAKTNLLEIWKGKGSFMSKFQTSFLLSRHVIYPLMLAQLLLLPPLMLYNVDLLPIMSVICLMILGPIAYLSIFSVVEGSFLKKLRHYSYMVLIGVGNIVSGTKAVIKGLLGSERRFMRTPKYGHLKSGEAWRDRIYRVSVNADALFESIFLVYSIIAVAISISKGYYLLIPYLLTFVAGFGYRLTLYLDQSLLMGVLPWMRPQTA